jgi:hypothetical protein
MSALPPKAHSAVTIARPPVTPVCSAAQLHFFRGRLGFFFIVLPAPIGSARTCRAISRIGPVTCADDRGDHRSGQLRADGSKLDAARDRGHHHPSYGAYVYRAARIIAQDIEGDLDPAATDEDAQIIQYMGALLRRQACAASRLLTHRLRRRQASS